MLMQRCATAVRTWAAMCSNSEAFYMEEPIQRNESTTVFLTAAGCVAGLSRKPHILTQSHRKEVLGKSQLSSHRNKWQRTRETPVGHAPEKQLTSETHTNTTDCKKTM